MLRKLLRSVNRGLQLVGMGVYYAENVAQYAQNPKVKRRDSRGFPDIKNQMFQSHDYDFSKSRDIIGNVTIRLPLYDFL